MLWNGLVVSKKENIALNTDDKLISMRQEIFFRQPDNGPTNIYFVFWSRHCIKNIKRKRNIGIVYFIRVFYFTNYARRSVENVCTAKC